MIYMLVRHQVEDYNKWRNVFDSAKELRRSNGEEHAQVFRDVDNPNSITVLNKWTSLDKAKEFMNSDAVKEKMKEAGLTSEPTVSFINEE